eukprot:CAMPEP_0203921870 /NCGR_PEP_ID=MMETSP0359-20131031/61977_1 /ASSEMBLY_ACC=CAM_ASM_000338 /TAXON_ID=268821 /ORGANISM="Scrippsiella Hangoei, Strain SHTV-5" /LENGTH=472 /DNA_ID=CAMNT_0050849635 /DNA_START=38 /DNA_END=1452 /DNA_ORIENTATION=-
MEVVAAPSPNGRQQRDDADEDLCFICLTSGTRAEPLMRMCLCEDRKAHSECFKMSQIVKVHDSRTTGEFARPTDIWDCKCCGSMFNLRFDGVWARYLCETPAVWPVLVASFLVMMFITCCDFSIMWMAMQNGRQPDASEMSWSEIFLGGMYWLGQILLFFRIPGRGLLLVVQHYLGDVPDVPETFIDFAKLGAVGCTVSYLLFKTASELYYYMLYFIAFTTPMDFLQGEATQRLQGEAAVAEAAPTSRHGLRRRAAAAARQQQGQVGRELSPQEQEAQAKHRQDALLGHQEVVVSIGKDCLQVVLGSVLASVFYASLTLQVRFPDTAVSRAMLGVNGAAWGLSAWLSVLLVVMGLVAYVYRAASKPGASSQVRLLIQCVNTVTSKYFDSIFDRREGDTRPLPTGFALLPSASVTSRGPAPTTARSAAPAASSAPSAADAAAPAALRAPPLPSSSAAASAAASAASSASAAAS